MNISSHLKGRIVLRPHDYDWQVLTDGVSQVILAGVIGEFAKATVLLRCEPNQSLTEPKWRCAQELLVLSGGIVGENANYAAGTYIRNPSGCLRNLTADGEGCLLFITLNPFANGDNHHTVVDPHHAKWRQGVSAGLQVQSLHHFETEHCALVRWAPNTQFQLHTHWGGEEILVIEGQLHDEHGCYPKGSWLRSPHLSEHAPYTKSEGALIYVKVGHLLEASCA